MGELYAYPQTTEWALDDAFFDVSAWLAEAAAQKFAELEGDAVIRGNGVTKPTGMLNTAPTNQPNAFPPVRAAAAYEYVASTVAGGIGTTGEPLIDLLYRVNATYRTGAVWVSSATAAVGRKLKDGQGNFLWQPAFAAGQPEQLLGYRTVIWEQMDNIAANAHPIAFGDFSRGYLLVDRVGLRITVDANITTPGRIKYFIRRREGGHVLNNDAIKFLKAAVS
jgi:HK97 family phage major capsid protein